MNLKFRSEYFKNKGEHYSHKIVNEIIKVKYKDEKGTIEELTLKKTNLRKKIFKTFGQHSKTTSMIIKKLKTEAQHVKTENGNVTSWWLNGGIVHK